MEHYVLQASKALKKYPTPLMVSYFSGKNMSTIQSELRRQVYKRVKQTIDKQCNENIFTVMMFMYVNFGKDAVANTSAEVASLNKRVLGDLVPMVSTNVMHYLRYVNDLNTLPTPMDYGETTSVKGDNSLELPEFKKVWSQ